MSWWVRQEGEAPPSLPLSQTCPLAQKQTVLFREDGEDTLWVLFCVWVIYIDIYLYISLSISIYIYIYIYIHICILLTFDNNNDMLLRENKETWIVLSSALHL